MGRFAQVVEVVASALVFQTSTVKLVQLLSSSGTMPIDADTMSLGCLLAIWLVLKLTKERFANVPLEE